MKNPNSLSTLKSIVKRDVEEGKIFLGKISRVPSRGRQDFSGKTGRPSNKRSIFSNAHLLFFIMDPVIKYKIRIKITSKNIKLV